MRDGDSEGDAGEEVAGRLVAVCCDGTPVFEAAKCALDQGCARDSDRIEGWLARGPDWILIVTLRGGQRLAGTQQGLLGPEKSLGLRVAKARGHKRAVLAVASKLAVIKHAMWRDGTAFRFGAGEPVAAGSHRDGGLAVAVQEGSGLNGGGWRTGGVRGMRRARNVSCRRPRPWSNARL